MELIQLYHGAITIEHDGHGNGSVTNLLQEPEGPVCTDPNCNCDYHAAIDGITSLLLALACAGVNMEAIEVEQAVQTAVDKVLDRYGD